MAKKQGIPWRSLREEEDFNDAVELEVLCNETYCPFFMEHHSSPNNPSCEGRWCEEAWGNFCDQNDREYEV